MKKVVLILGLILTITFCGCRSLTYHVDAYTGRNEVVIFPIVRYYNYVADNPNLTWADAWLTRPIASTVNTVVDTAFFPIDACVCLFKSEPKVTITGTEPGHVTIHTHTPWMIYHYTRPEHGPLPYASFLQLDVQKGNITMKGQWDRSVDWPHCSPDDPNRFVDVELTVCSKWAYIKGIEDKVLYAKSFYTPNEGESNMIFFPPVNVESANPPAEMPLETPLNFSIAWYAMEELSAYTKKHYPKRKPRLFFLSLALGKNGTLEITKSKDFVGSLKLAKTGEEVDNISYSFGD